MKLWIDDERDPKIFTKSDGWTWVKTSQAAMNMIDLRWDEITDISFDHDLGLNSFGTGYDVACYIERLVYEDNWSIANKRFAVHSANPVGSKNIKAVFRSMYEFDGVRRGLDADV